MDCVEDMEEAGILEENICIESRTKNILFFLRLILLGQQEGVLYLTLGYIVDKPA